MCECVKDLLNTDIESLSLEILNFLDKMITPADYKICHEIFINCLQETSKLPSILNGTYHRMSKKIKAMLIKLLDRKNLVVPPICCYADIMVAFNKPNVYPHWTVSELLNDYVATFNSLTDLFNIENSEHFRPVVRHSQYAHSNWKLDPNTLTYNTVNPQFWVLRFPGPYGKPQHDLMMYTLRQVGCKELIFTVMLGLRHGKQTVCPELEKVFLRLLKETCREAEAKDSNALQRMKVWERLGGELSHFIFANAVNIKTFCEVVYREGKQQQTMPLFQRHRDFIMWSLNRCVNFGLKVIKLKTRELIFIGDMILMLYPEQSPLPVPDMSSPLSSVYLSAAMLWTMFATRTNDNPGIHTSPPPALMEHINFLVMPGHNFTLNDYTACICLDYINNFLINVAGPEGTANKPIKFFLDSIFVNNMEYYLPGNVAVPNAIRPLPLELLDSLTAHAKMNFLIALNSRISHYSKMITPQEMQVKYNHQLQLTPALIETYSRLLSYSEIHFLSMKMMLTLFSLPLNSPNAHKVAISLLEMCTYRMQYLKTSQHKIQILTNLQTIANNVTHSAPPHPQMNYLVESFAIKAILALNYNDLFEISKGFSPMQNMGKVLSTTSVELNKVFVLAASRAIVISRNNMSQNQWLAPFFESMLSSTPAVRDWSSYTQSHFPPAVQSYCNTQDQMTQNIGENISMFISSQQIGPNQDIAKHFIENDTNSFFLCVILRKYMETDILPSYTHKVANVWTPAILKKQIRNLIQFVVSMLQGNMGNIGPQNMFNRIANVLDEFIYRYFLFPIDTFILIACLQKYTEQGFNIAYYLIYTLIVKKATLKDRVDYFVKNAWPNFWQQNGEHSWSKLHSAYHDRYPEHNYFQQQGANTIYLPVFYSNICLRFIPVLDILIHRLIETSQRNTIRTMLVDILNTFGRLYSFHDSPVTYLHNTLYYYDNILSTDKEILKRLLVARLLEYQLLQPLEKFKRFADYLLATSDEASEKNANFINYRELLADFTDVINSKLNHNMYNVDWKYNEFSNPVAYRLYIITVQLMCIPIHTSDLARPHAEVLAEHRANIGTQLVEVVLGSKAMINDYANTLGLIFSALPLSFSVAVFNKVSVIIRDRNNFYETEVNDLKVPKIHWNSTAQNLLIIVHSFFQHCKADKLESLQEFLNSNIKFLVMESQVLYILKLISPFIRHIIQDRTHTRNPTLSSLLSCLYQIIFNLLSESTVCNPDLFVDYMYYNKYIFIGDELKPLIERHLNFIPKDVAAKLKILAYN